MHEIRIKVFFFFFDRVIRTKVFVIFDYFQLEFPIDFWYRWELNLESLIQPSDTLSVEQIRTHTLFLFYEFKFQPK